MPSAAAIDEGLALVEELAAAGRMPPSERLWSVLLPALDGSHQRLALYWLGKGRVAAGDFAGAADFFLQSATRLGADAADPLTLDARFHAARSLAQAGWRTDARAQFR